MEESERKTIEVEVRDTLVAAARRFMALHPDVKAVGLTVVSEVIDPRVVSTTVVGSQGPLDTPDKWSLAARRFIEAAAFCGENQKHLMMGLDDLANEIARAVDVKRVEHRELELAVEGLRDEQRRLRLAAQDTTQAPGQTEEGGHDHGER